jgi:hypothetical protein
VAVSANGSTIISGAYGDNEEAGCAFVFALVSGNYTQQARLTGASGGSYMGYSVALDAEGVTAFVGAPDSGGTGSTWVFGYIDGNWTQVGSSLVDSSAIGAGSAVQVNSAGTLVVIGEDYENRDIGGAALWALSSGNWTQISELVGTGNTLDSYQGFSVAMSSDGSLVAVGGDNDDGGVGAVWVFTCG